MNTKQIIVIRKDLKMRTGKACSQVAHASMSFLTKGMFIGADNYTPNSYVAEQIIDSSHYEEVKHWLENSFRKICVYVNSEQELDELHAKALEKGLTSHLIVDNGATEFKGVPTKTCLAIGPHEDSRFEDITNHLPLL